MGNFYGLIGEKLDHSISPQIHKLILEKINSKGLYNIFEIKRENLKAAVDGLKALGAKGINITIPYKIEIMQYLDEISKEAEKIGAINTICFSNGILKGYNTDYHGFGAALNKAKVDVQNKEVVILGSGGAAKAVAQYLIDNEIKDIIYVSRNPENTAENMKDFKIISYNDINNLMDTDIIINCTPCGMYPKVKTSPVNKNIFSKFSTAVDLIYNPEETLYLREAREAGLKTVNGLYMLVAQAVAAQEIWHDINISEQIVEEIYKEIYNKVIR